MEKEPGPGSSFIEGHGQKNHQDEIEKLPQKNGKNLPEQGNHIGKLLEGPHFVQGIRQHLFQQGNLLEGIEDAVDPVGIFQGKGNPKGLIHGLPPAALR